MEALNYALKLVGSFNVGMTIGKILVYLSAVCGGIACGGDRNFFQSDTVPRTVLMAQKSERNFFQRDPRPADPIARIDELPSQDVPPPPELPAEDVAPLVPVPDPAPVPVGVRPPVHEVPSLSFVAFLRNALETDEQLPLVLGEEPPEGFKKIDVDLYCPPGCVYCPPCKERMHENPFINFIPHASEMPYRVSVENQDKVLYPLALCRDVRKFFTGDDLASVQTLLDAILDARKTAGLETADYTPEDVIVGSVPRDLVESLATIKKVDMTLNIAENHFTHGAFSVAIPDNAEIRGKGVKGGLWLDFIGAKPTIRANGFWTLKRNINSVSIPATRDRITLHLNWWKTLTWKVEK